jgi:hypothetical protein
LQYWLWQYLPLVRYQLALVSLMEYEGKLILTGSEGYKIEERRINGK